MIKISKYGESNEITSILDGLCSQRTKALIPNIYFSTVL